MTRRIALCLLSLLFLAGGLMPMPATAQSTVQTVTIDADKAFFRPGEPATFTVTASDGARVVAVVTHLLDEVAQIEAPLQDGRASLRWDPPADAPRGYGLQARVLDAAGNEIAVASAAFDVLDHWLQAPRYGFLSEFGPERDNAEATMAWAARYHINGLQFYDWQYRHEQLVPPEDPYTDPLGRRLSLETVTRLIDAAHARNIAAMPYTAIYGATPAFYEQHPDWALFQADGVPFDFGDGFLKIMNPTPGSPWADHLLDQFAQVLDQTAFDGIHLDQYGAPKTGRDNAGEPVDLAEVFPAFIDQAARVVRERREGGAMIFNAVGNWPVETVAPSDQDVVYIEVWPPYRDFLDLHAIIAQAQTLGGGKPVIIAAYIHPNNAHNVRLANAVIFGSGAYHLELGEPGAMLADPYFPKFGEMNDDMQRVMQRIYDFVVRYEEVLGIGTQAATEARAGALAIEGVKTDGTLSKNRVAVIVREGDERETFSLVNFMGLAHGKWLETLFQGPEPLRDLAVTLAVERPVERVWLASPDGDDLSPQTVTFEVNDGAIRFTVPSLDYWTMIVVEYAHE
jgi:dextranase